MPYANDPLQLEPSDHVCAEHIEDSFLARRIADYLDDDPAAGEPCGFCGEPGMPVDELVEIVSAAVDKFFDRANDAGVPFDEGDWALPVMSTDEVLADIGIDGDSPILNACWQTIDDDAWVPVGDGWPDERALLQSGWQQFSEHLKHRSRFLFETIKTDDTYGVIESLGTRDFLDRLLQAILARQPRVILDTMGVLYRARAFQERGAWPKEARGYTSPPQHLAAQGRMNPAGIAYFYGALEAETAAVEVYDGSAFAGVASFRPVRPLRLVDLRGAAIPSPFDDSVSLTEHRQTLFLHRFTQEIAQPIVRDGREHQEYVPTQAITEYIRFRSRRRLDGILYSSSRVGGSNAVIFVNQAECLGISASATALLEPVGTLELIEFGPPSVNVRGSEALI